MLWNSGAFDKEVKKESQDEYGERILIYKKRPFIKEEWTGEEVPLASRMNKIAENRIKPILTPQPQKGME